MVHSLERVLDRIDRTLKTNYIHPTFPPFIRDIVLVLVRRMVMSSYVYNKLQPAC